MTLASGLAVATLAPYVLYRTGLQPENGFMTHFTRQQSERQSQNLAMSTME